MTRTKALAVWLVVFWAALSSAPSSEAAAPVLTLESIELEGPCLRVRFMSSIASPGSESGLYYGTDTTPAGDFATRRNEVKLDSNERTEYVCGLAPETKYYFQPFATDVGGVDEARYLCPCTGCNLGPGLEEVHCDSESEPPWIVTSQFGPIADPAAPVHSYDPAPVPTITGQIFSVKTDAQGRCLDFSAQIAAAAAADSDLWHKVQIPSGAVCELMGYSFPARSGPGSGAGGILVTTAGDPRLFPPDGARIDPSYGARLARLQPSTEPDLAHRWLGNQVHESWMAFAAGADRYRFQNLEIAVADHRDLPVRRFDVQDLAYDGSTVTLTLDREHRFVPMQLVTIAMEEGCIGLQGVRQARKVDGNTIEIFNQDLSGSCTSGDAGTVTQAVSIPLASCSDSSPVLCDTAVPHGLARLERLPILSIGGANHNKLQVDEMHRAANAGSRYVIRGQVIRVTGSPNGMWDGLHGVANANWTQITLGESFEGDCAASCGFFERVDVIQVAETSNPALNAPFHFAVVDSDTILLEGSTAAGGANGGFLSYDPDVFTPFLDINRNQPQELVFDRVLIDCGGFPYRSLVCIDASKAIKASIINSFIRDGNHWFPVDPITNLWFTYNGANRGRTVSFGLIKHEAHDLQVRNNTFYNFRGIGWFSDGARNPPGADRSFVRNLYYSSDSLTAGSARSDGRFYGHRHCWESKGSERVLLKGNWFSGNPVDQVPSGSCLLVSPRSPTGYPFRYVRDVAIVDNIIERSAGGIGLLTETGAERNIGPTRRILIANNLMRDVDYYEYGESPSGFSGDSQPNGWGGFFLETQNATADLKVLRNTHLPARGKGAYVMRLIRYPQSLFQFEDNIFSVMSGIGIFGDARDSQLGCTSTSGISLFNCMVRSGADPDLRSTFDSNTLIGCLEAPAIENDAAFEAAMSSAKPSDSMHRNEVVAEWSAISRQSPNLFAGSTANNDSCKERIDEVFEERTYRPKPRFAADGADIDRLLDAQGQVRGVTLSLRSDNRVEISYRAPDTEACLFDYSTDSSFSDPDRVQRVSDGGGALQRTVILDPLQPGEYWYRLQCSAHQPRGRFSL